MRKRVVVVGDSWMSPHINNTGRADLQDIEGKHFTELLAKEFDWNIIHLSRSSASNNLIRLQVETAVEKYSPHLIFYGTTTPCRTEIPTGLAEYELGRYLNNFNYFEYSSALSSELVKAENPAMIADSISNVIEDHARKTELLNEHQIKAMELSTVHLYHEPWKEQLDAWIVQSGVDLLKRKGIPFVLIPQWFLMRDYKHLFESAKHIAPDELCPWHWTQDQGSFARPYHVDDHNQMLGARKWILYLIQNKLA